MGFFEKVKNMFTEEIEDDEVKVEKIKNEVTHVEIESPVKNDDKIENYVSSYNFKSLEETKPIFFDDEDFSDVSRKEENIEKEEEYKKEDKKMYYSKKEEKPLYGMKKEEKKEETKVFKPTPIISPIYGVLDKNYHKEDIVTRSEKKNIASKKFEDDIDNIRDKAYGTLEDELENTLFGSNSILFKNDPPKESDISIEEVSDDILTDLTEDISKELDELLIKKEKYYDEELEKEEKPKHSGKKKEESKIEDVEEQKELDDEDLLDFIDSTLYKDGDE